MADISNKTLTLFLLVAMVVSLSGFIVTFSRMDTLGITGRAATDTGETNFSINSSLSVVFIQNLVEFGAGIVNGSGSHNCTLNTSISNPTGGPDCIGFNTIVAPLRVQNQGTQNVSLNITFNATAAVFIGGTTPSFSFKATHNETGACGNMTGAGSLSFTATNREVSAANTNFSICNSTKFDWITGNRTLNIDLGIRIPQDAEPGARRVTVTAFASSP